MKENNIIYDLKIKLERERSKNKVLLEIIKDINKCIENSKKFINHKDDLIRTVKNPFISNK